MDWEKFRNADGSIDIMQAFYDRNKSKSLPSFHVGASIVSLITSLYHIKSRQLATTIFIFAIHLSEAAESKVKEALDLIEEYGGVDGGHHKQWILDQLVRTLSDDYEGWVSEYEKCEEDPEDYYEWDTGIAP